MSDPHAPTPWEWLLDRPDDEDRADNEGVEPYDGDTGAERDRVRHVDRERSEDW